MAPWYCAVSYAPFLTGVQHEDFRQGRPTENAFINGEVVRLAEQAGLSHRIIVQRRVYDLIADHERRQVRPNYSPRELRRLLLGPAPGISRYAILFIAATMAY